MTRIRRVRRALAGGASPPSTGEPHSHQPAGQESHLVSRPGSDGLTARIIQDLAAGAERSGRPEQARSQDRELPAAHDSHAPPAAAHHPALRPLPAKPGRVLGQPPRRPDGTPPMVPVLLPGPRPSLSSHPTVRSLDKCARAGTPRPPGTHRWSCHTPHARTVRKLTNPRLTQKGGQINIGGRRPVRGQSRKHRFLVPRVPDLTAFHALIRPLLTAGPRKRKERYRVQRTPDHCRRERLTGQPPGLALRPAPGRRSRCRPGARAVLAAARW